MNRNIFNYYIKEYKLNFDKISQQEIYKWKAVKCFQDNWDIDSDNFHEMLMKSIKLTDNLLISGKYFPRRMLSQYSEQRPIEVRQLFIDLYNEDEDLYDRIKNFQVGINKINDELSPGKKSYQDHRAIIAYLTLRFPERYFFYKFKMYKTFSNKVDLSYKPVKGHIENIGHFNSQLEFIRHKLSIDQELLKLHKNRITEDCYYEDNLNILTQDFIYAVANHLGQNQNSVISVPPEKKKTKETKAITTELKLQKDQINFRGRKVNFIQNNIDNKDIGYLGERWVVRYEIEKLKKANKNNISKKVKHTSIEEGDGTGFDIQSFDIKGNQIFIEVKTTKGGRNSTFYITRNELERSKIEKDKYYIYRLYNYNESDDYADLFIINGDLSNLCQVPTTYKIDLMNN